MNNVLQILVIALLAEAIWENLKMIWQNGKFSVDRIGALVVGIIVCLATKLDVFQVLEFGIVIPFVGSILTGILISRGANFMHDFLSKVENLNISK